MNTIASFLAFGVVGEWNGGGDGLLVDNLGVVCFSDLSVSYA